MPPKGSKRRGGAAGAGAKKAKLDPVAAKVKELADFLKDDASSEVPGPESCRLGILAAMPYALGLGAAIDERHGFQKQVVTIVGEVLDASEAKWLKRVADATSALENGKNEKATRDAVLEATKGRLSAAKTAVEESKAQLQDDIASEGTARTNLKTATAEVENFDTLQAEKEKEKDEYASLCKDVFLVLKAGDKKPAKGELNMLTTKLRKLKVDDSLLNAVAPALTKKPTDRGGFDETVVSQVESSLQKHVSSLEEELGNGPAVKSRKESEKDEAQATMEKAEAKRAASVDALKSAETKVTEIEAEEVQATEACEKQEEVVSDLDNALLTETCGLDNCREALKTFAFLRDRVGAEPEPAEPEAAEGEPMATEAEPAPAE